MPGNMMGSPRRRITFCAHAHTHTCLHGSRLSIFEWQIVSNREPSRQEITKRAPNVISDRSSAFQEGGAVLAGGVASLHSKKADES